MTEVLERVSQGYQKSNQIEEFDQEAREKLREEFLDDLKKFVEMLEEGEIRAAERNDNGEWEANPRVKEGILLAFKLGENVPFEGGYMEFQDKDTLPPQEEFEDARVVPGGSSIRSGAHVGDIIQMPPSYVNVGAYVDDGSMVDSEALVGSAAQVGKNVHLSTGAKLGGVLEPVNQSPVVIEDDVTVGANSGIYEGVVVRENAVIAPGVEISGSTEIYDTVEDEVYTMEVPENAVVIPGSVEYDEVNGETVHKDVAVVAKYRDESTDADTALEEALR